MPRYAFDRYVVDTDTVEVVGPEGPREFEPQVFAVLQYLIEQAGRVVTKEELLDNVWGDRFVSESTVTTRIKQARRVVGDDGQAQWAIKTVHGRGYRFLPETSVVAATRPLRPVADAPMTALPGALQPDIGRRLVGRDPELARAWAVIDRPGRDDPIQWIWLLGEPGIGKSRLAAEIASHAHTRGHRVLFGRNDEDLEVPYQPFIEALRSALGGPAADASALALGPHAGELSRLLPELADHPPGVAPPALDRSGAVYTDDHVQRHRLFEAVAGWLTEHSADAPTCIVIDDAHWARDSTLQLLAHLQQRRTPARVTIVVTARDTAPDEHPGVADLVAAGQGAGSTTVLRLGGLDGEAAAHLVGARADLATALRQTAGNPLLLLALNPDDGSVDLPSAVRRRLAHLDATVQQALRLASVIGLEFDLRVLAEVAARDELDVLDDLEAAVAARLLDDVGRDRFRFAHALIRSSLRDELSSSRRARVHARVAAAVHGLFPGDRRHLQALAHHTAEAVQVDPALRALAVERLRAAAGEASAQLSFGEAAARLAQARLLLEDDDDVALRARLAVEQGEAETRGGAGVLAARTFDEAIAEARRSGDARLRVSAALGYEDAAWRPGLPGLPALDRIAEAVEVLDHAVLTGVVSSEEELELRTRLQIGHVRALAMAGEASQAEEPFETALALARRLGRPVIEAGLLNVYLGHLRPFSDRDDLGAMVARLAELSPRIDDLDVALHALHVRAMHALLTGDVAAYRQLRAEMKGMESVRSSRFWAYVGANQDAMMAFYEGDLGTSERLAADCLAMADQMPEEDGSGAYGLRMFMIRREQDRLVAMAPLIQQIVGAGKEGGEGFWRPGLALLLVESGAHDQARTLLDDVLSIELDRPRDSLWSTVMVLLVEAAVQLGDRAACAALLERVTRLTGTNVVTGAGQLCLGSADRYLGMLCSVTGDLDAADEHLGVALSADAAGGSVLWSNESRLWMARVRRARGHAAEAEAMVAVVAAQAEAAGLARLQRLAAAEPTTLGAG